MLFVGEDQNDFTQPKAFSQPFTVAGAGIHRRRDPHRSRRASRPRPRSVTGQCRHPPRAADPVPGALRPGAPGLGDRRLAGPGWPRRHVHGDAGLHRDSRLAAAAVTLGMLLFLSVPEGCCSSARSPGPGEGHGRDRRPHPTAHRGSSGRGRPDPDQPDGHQVRQGVPVRPGLQRRPCAADPRRGGRLPDRLRLAGDEGRRDPVLHRPHLVAGRRATSAPRPCCSARSPSPWSQWPSPAPSHWPPP